MILWPTSAILDESKSYGDSEQWLGLNWTDDIGDDAGIL